MENLKTLKTELRKLVDQKGGVSQVAKLMGIAQPSLSRMLNSDSPIRKNYLLRLTEILNTDIEKLVETRVLTIKDIDKYKDAIVNLIETSHYIGVIDKSIMVDIVIEVIQKLYNFGELEKSYIKLAVNNSINSN